MKKLKTITRLLCIAAPIVLFSNCGTGTNKSQVPVIAYTILPAQQNAVAIKAAPNTYCSLVAGSGASSDTLYLSADAQGYATFYIYPQLGYTAQLLTLSYGTVQQGIYLRGNLPPSKDTPLPAPEPIPAATTANTRPALTPQQMQQMTNPQLAAKGYPPRPDTTVDPEGYADWAMAVSTPTRIASDTTIINTHIVHLQAPGHPPVVVGTADSSSSTSSWSGYLLQAGGPFSWTTATWVVPAVSTQPTVNAFSAVWVGLRSQDGHIIQAGTEQDCIYTQSAVISAYCGWNEYLATQNTEQVVTDFPTRPGDRIHVQVWMGNAMKDPSQMANCYYQFENLTAKVTTKVHTKLAHSEQTVDALWITEAPQLSNGTVIAPLAKYDSFVMSSAHCYHPADTLGNFLAYGLSGDSSNHISMWGSTGLMSSALPLVNPRNAMRFVWSNYK